MKDRFSSPFSALKYRNFKLLWVGLLISRIGSEMQVVAVNWHVYLLTKSAFSLGLIGLFRFLPIISFSLLGGLAADIINRKKLMIISQIVLALSALILTAITIQNLINPLLIYILIAINSMASAFETPARQSITPSLVPRRHFSNAVSLNVVMWQTAIVLGPSIAGFIIGFFGIGSVYLINSLSFLAVIISLLLINTEVEKNRAQSKNTFSFSSIREGFQFVFKTPIIYATMFLDFFATFFSSANVLLPIFAKDILMVGPQGLGFLYAAPAFGAIIFGFLISSLKTIKHQGQLLFSAVLVYGLATFLFALSRNFYLSLFFLFLTGGSDAISTVIRNTIRQLKTPDYLRGRMVSINMIFFMGGPQLGELEAGILAALIGAPLSVAVGGIGTILATLTLAFFIPTLRRYKGEKVVI